ncbi:minor tail protein [Gordonia phage GTE8]|uniref:Minor tail protein n=1 Tax=Gordonia phage GTE8 TaxID=1647475 RepID=A0A0K0N6I3_9CAUD|nr:minor tail protein [Gordonia phage GTE8]AKJ72352.1 hypothetical protein GTE8_9 [Gordonia phage GTE8]
MAKSLGTVFPTKSAVEWAAFNPLLAEGQGAYEADTGGLKIGDGSTLYNDLPYFVGSVSAVSDEQLSEALDGKELLGKSSQPFRIYGTDEAGDQALYPINFAAEPETIVARNGDGTFDVGAPVGPNNPMTKSYGDNRYAPTVDARVPAANLPQAFRTTDSQPFSADSHWNTPIGTGATFESSSAAATANLLTATPAINDGKAYGFTNNIARPTDPLCTAVWKDSGGVVRGTFLFKCPYDPIISSGTDLSMRVIDGRWAYDLWKTTRTGVFKFEAEFITKTDLLGTGRNAGTRAARWPTAGGLIRAHEMTYIPHAIAMSIPPACLKRGFVWPAAAEDAAGVIYSGEVPMGSFFAIPPSVNLDSLGLSIEGYALAEAMQNYGVYIGDASGSAAISVDGEAYTSARPALERMRTDWTTKIFAQLRRVTNVADPQPGGPGPRKVPPTGPVTVRGDSQDFLVDNLSMKLQALLGYTITSDDFTVPAETMVPTTASQGGKPVNWTGYPLQYRIVDGAIKRIAAPDGQTRLLMLAVGKRDVRVKFRVKALHASGFCYVALAVAGSGENYRLAITSQGSCHLQRLAPGEAAVAITPGTPNGTIGANKDVEVSLRGNRLEYKVDGEVMGEVYDTAEIAGTNVGIWFPSDTNIGWTNLVVQTIPRLTRKISAG